MRDPRAHPIRLLMVDDHEVLRLGLRTLFSEAGGFEVVGEAGTMAEAISKARELDPDVILMDVRLPDGSGVEACREIRTQRPQTCVLFLTSYADDAAVLATILAGAQGFLLKEVGSDELLRAVRTVAGGQSKHCRVQHPPIRRGKPSRHKNIGFSRWWPKERRTRKSPSR
jgi:two-component system response regulator DevR